MRTRLIPMAIVVVLILETTTIPSMCFAQSTARFVSLTAGRSSYDLAGTGTAPVLALGVGLPLGGPLSVEPGVSYFRYNEQLGSDVTYLFSELSILIQGHLGRVAPFIGVGGGRGFQVSGPTPHQHAWTLHALGGVRLNLSPTWGVRGDIRLRGVDPFHATTADYTVGVVRFFR